MTYLPAAALTLASLILAAEPVLWLIRSWQDPAYQSSGHCYVIALIAAGALSWRSGPPRALRPNGSILLIFFAAAMLRLLGQVLAVNILSALALAVDVFAIARLLRLDLRPLALSPFWLAAFFLFALPLAPILERVLGFPLQMVSARVSCAMLDPFFSDLTCNGVRLQVNGVDVMVDLPCSGATGLLLMLALWTGMNAFLRPTLKGAALGLLAVLFAALMGNGLRISLLAGGLGAGINTMLPWLHSAIGMAALILAAAPFIFLYRPAKSAGFKFAFDFALPPHIAAVFAVFAFATSLLIVSAPKEPIDRSDRVAQRLLPTQLLGHAQAPQPLSEIEQQYFSAYGGLAQKASYGALGLNLVQTGSPLRHLHSPATCLLGMGYEVTFLGTRFDPVPSSVYRATGPDGQVWHVSVSFVSDSGEQTASVGQAVWSWLTGQSRNWTAIQRITPASLSPQLRAALEQAALTALDI